MAADNASLDPALLVHGAEIWDMLAYTRWVHRRVEQISFVDARTARRRISVDFQLRKSYARPRKDQLTNWYVPLALQRKSKPLIDFDLFDEESRTLPLVAREETQRVTAAALIALAAWTLRKEGRTLSHEMGEALQEVAACGPDRAKEAIKGALQPRAAGRLLARNPFMERMIGDLAHSFLVLVSISDPEQRRVIKFSYLEELELPHLTMPMALGWHSIPFRFPTGGVSMARSYHCEVSAPPNLEILQAKLSASDRRDKEENVHSDTPSERVHLQLSEVPSHWNAELVADLRAGRPGMAQTAAMLAVAVSLLLTAGALFHWLSEKSGDTAAALLVAIPALLAAYLSRPEHQLAGRLLRGIRWMTAAIGLLAFLAAASTVVVEPTFTIWISIAGVAWLLTFALGLSAILPRAAQKP